MHISAASLRISRSFTLGSLTMKETSTINRRDLLLGASPNCDLDDPGSGDHGQRNSPDSNDCRGLCADVFQSRRVELHKRRSRSSHSKRRARPWRPGNGRA